MCVYIQIPGGYVAYDVVLDFALAENETQLLNLTISEMSAFIGSDCSLTGPIPYTMKRQDEISIPILPRDCIAQFVFQAEASSYLYCRFRGSYSDHVYGIG